MVFFGIGELVIVFLIFSYVGLKIFSVPVFLAIAVGLIISLYLYIRGKYGLWKQLGVDGPPQTPGFGDLINFATKGVHVMDPKYRKQYGDMWGSYLFTTPELVITDVDILKNVLVKDFDAFTNRRTFREKDAPNRPNAGILDKIMTVLYDEHWKRIRNVITPAFTLGKIKLTIPMIRRATDTLISVLEETRLKNEPFEVKESFGCFTMDVICSVAFGVQVDSQRNPNEPVVTYAKEAFLLGFKNIRVLIALLFPLTFKYLREWFNIRIIFKEGEEFFNRTLGRVLEDRRKHPKIPPDFMQHLVDGSFDRNFTATGQDKEHQNPEPIPNDEILAQMFIFLLAGYDTTATTITFAMYHIAIDPEIQEKCYEEIMRAYGDKDELDYDKVHDLVYLEAVISEGLRMYPPAPRLDRIASRSVKITDDLTIPEGCAVVAPIYLVHHMEEYYPDPEKFDPERFMPEQKATRDPLTYLPFGYGPRNCIGMRFAMVEMKLVLAGLLKKYRFVPTENIEIPLTIESTGLTKPVNQIFLNMTLRD